MKKYLVLSEKNKNDILHYMPKTEITERLADFFHNFSDFTRLRIIICLSLCDMCVNDLSILLMVNQTTISHQLQILRNQNLVFFKRKGKILIYCLKQNAINDLMLGAINSLS